MASLSHSLRLLLVAIAVASGVASADDRDVAATFSKAAVYAFRRDFIYEPVAKWFTAEELALLEQHKEFLEPMVSEALTPGSVGGALLTAHFKLKENLPQLRWLLFQPGRPYGWEGRKYDSEEDYLTDAQYVYHSVYLRAIEETAGAPIHEVVTPTPEETEMLLRLVAGQQGDEYYWAKWLSRKFRLLPAAR
jgi:hypothetical protein